MWVPHLSPKGAALKSFSKKSRRSYDQFTNGGNFGKPFLSVPEIFAEPVELKPQLRAIKCIILIPLYQVYLFQNGVHDDVIDDWINYFISGI
jgi:hypothetical protein